MGDDTSVCFRNGYHIIFTTKVNLCENGKNILLLLERDQKLFLSATSFQQFFQRLLWRLFLLQDNARNDVIRIGLLLFFLLFNHLVQFLIKNRFPIFALGSVVEVIIVVARQAFGRIVDEAEFMANRGVEARNSFLAAAASRTMRSDSNLGQNAINSNIF